MHDNAWLQPVEFPSFPLSGPPQCTTGIGDIYETKPDAERCKLESFTAVLAFDVGGTGLRVNCPSSHHPAALLSGLPSERPPVLSFPLPH